MVTSSRLEIIKETLVMVNMILQMDSHRIVGTCTYIANTRNFTLSGDGILFML